MTKDYKTQTFFQECSTPTIEGKQLIALDIGYSGTKGYYAGGYFCFPSFAKPLEGSLMSLAKPNPTDILYRDEKGKHWYVGEIAQSVIKKGDLQEKELSLYGRNRYNSEMFQVIARTGLALAMPEQSSSPIYLQTGLPPEYLTADTMILKEIFAGRHRFALKVGDSPWKNYSIELDLGKIKVMSQPMGSLMSAVMNQKGYLLGDASDYFQNGVLIFDPGFGTLDIFSARNLAIESWQTYKNLGMKEVFQRTLNQLKRQHGVEMTIPEFQNYLTEGSVKKMNVKQMRTERISFESYLYQASKEVCMEAIEAVKSSYNYFQDHKYLLITGGTGAAWIADIKKHLEGMEELQVIPVNKNEDIPFVIGNVRGYYLFSLNQLRKSIS